MPYLIASDPLSGAVVNSLIIRKADGAIIPSDPLNTDWQAYQAWLKAGNKPEEPKPIRDR